MRHSKLTAISTFFQPHKRKSNITYIAKNPAFKPSQIDYILISSRRATAVRDCKVKWGLYLQRWGRHYDHGLIRCIFKTRIKMQQRTAIALDYGTLKTDAVTRAAFDECVADKLNSDFNQDDASESLTNLQKAVTTAATSNLPKRTPCALRRRNNSTHTRDLYASR